MFNKDRTVPLFISFMGWCLGIIFNLSFRNLLESGGNFLLTVPVLKKVAVSSYIYKCRLDSLVH